MSQSKHSTSQCNGWRLTCCGSHQKHRIEIPISKSIFNPPPLHHKQRIFMQDKRTLKLGFKLMQNSRLNSDAVIDLAKLINHLYNLCKTKWIKNQLWNRSVNQMFSTTSVIFTVFIRPLHCDVTCFDCDGWKPSTMYIFNAS